MTTMSPPRGRPGPAPQPAPVPGVGPAPRPPVRTVPTHAVPALLGALAVLGGTLAIPPMISGGDWFWATAEVVMVIWLVGVGARLARVPDAGVVAMQLVAASIALTALFTVRGYGGVIPNGAALGEAGDLLTGAWTQIRTTVSPAPSSRELSFLICVSVSTTALIVDMLITWCRAPALVALPLLCLYAVPASIDMSQLPWSAFAVPAVLYAMLLVVSGFAGRQVGAGVGIAQVASGFVLACVATVVALLVADSVTGIGTAGRLPRTNSGASAGIGLSSATSLTGNLERGDPVDLLRVSGLPGPAYLRTVGLQRWTGQGFDVDQIEDGPLPNDPVGVGQTQVTVTPLTRYNDRYLPIYRGVTAVDGIGSGWSFDSSLGSVHRPDAITPGTYRVTARFAEPTADELRADTATAAGALTEIGDLRPEAVTAATEATAGAATAFDKADRLRSYFSTANGFEYSDQVPAGTSGDPLLDFLENKQGACQQYASAMAVMLRAVGVPARVAVGYTQGAPGDNGDYIISSHDAHAWVEVLFDNAGWVEFDPTPLGNGQGGQQGYTGGAGSATTAPTTSDAPAPIATAGDEGLGEEQIPTGGVSATSGAADQAAAGDDSIVPTGVLWALGILAVLAALTAGPTVLRRRRRVGRLAVADAGGPDAAAAAWREIEDLAVDHAIALDPAQSARACANRLAKAAHLTETGRAQLRELVAAAERGWYSDGAEPDAAGAAHHAAPGAVTRGSVAGGSVATNVGQVGRLGDAPRTLAVELGHAAPLSLLDRLVPRSVRPAWWRG